MDNNLYLAYIIILIGTINKDSPGILNLGCLGK